MGRRLDQKRWKRDFLAALARTGNVRLAAERAKVDKGTPYNARARDAGFSAAWARALAWGQARMAAGAADPEDAAGPLTLRLSKSQGAQLVKSAKGRWSGEMQIVFEDALRRTGTIRRAAAAAGISTAAVYKRRARYPDLAERWKQAKEEGLMNISRMLIEGAEAGLDPDSARRGPRGSLLC